MGLSANLRAHLVLFQVVAQIGRVSFAWESSNGDPTCRFLIFTVRLRINGIPMVYPNSAPRPSRQVEHRFASRPPFGRTGVAGSLCFDIGLPSSACTRLDTQARNKSAQKRGGVHLRPPMGWPSAAENRVGGRQRPAALKPDCEFHFLAAQSPGVTRRPSEIHCRACGGVPDHSSQAEVSIFPFCDHFKRLEYENIAV
jgi:hypothetical protein